MIFLLVFSFLLLCFAAVGAHSLGTFSSHQVEEYCKRYNLRLRIDDILKRQEQAVFAAQCLRLLSITTVFLVAFHWVVFSSEIEPYRHHFQTEIFTLVWLGAALVVADLWLPHAVAAIGATPFVCASWPFWRLLMLLFHPLELGARFVSLFFHRLAGRQPSVTDEDHFEDEIMTIVTEGHREGHIEEGAREMIESVIELADITVSEIMTPRTDMKSIPDSMSWDELLLFVTTGTHSRLPVYHENRDDIIGVLYVKDLLPELAKTNRSDISSHGNSWTKLLRQPVFVPETKPVRVLLQEFQNVHWQSQTKATRTHLAMVLDEYGGVAGIVTLEDILEEIVGEILDEHDIVAQHEDIKETGPGVYEILGRVHVDTLNEHLGLSIPDEEDYDTIAGYVFSTLGHVPVVGEFLELDGGVKLTVLDATPRRIERLRLERPK